MADSPGPGTGAGAWHPGWGPRGDTEGPVGERKRWGLPAWVLAALLVVGGVWLFVFVERTNSFCEDTVSIRREIAEVSLEGGENAPAAIAEIAAAWAPGLAERAEKMSGGMGSEAEEIAAALTEIAASDTLDDQREPMQRFVELDNDFRHRHCNGER